MKTKLGIRTWRKRRLMAGLLLMAAFGVAEVWMLTHWQSDWRRVCQYQSVGPAGAVTGFHLAGE